MLLKVFQIVNVLPVQKTDCKFTRIWGKIVKNEKRIKKPDVRYRWLSKGCVGFVFQNGARKGIAQIC